MSLRLARGGKGKADRPREESGMFCASRRDLKCTCVPIVTPRLATTTVAVALQSALSAVLQPAAQPVQPAAGRSRRAATPTANPPSHHNLAAHYCGTSAVGTAVVAEGQ